MTGSQGSRFRRIPKAAMIHPLLLSVQLLDMEEDDVGKAWDEAMAPAVVGSGIHSGSASNSPACAVVE